VIPIRDNVPTRHFPVVTLALIIANVLVFLLYQAPDLDESFRRLGFHPCEVVDRCPVVGEDWPPTVFTAMFLHGDLLHLGGNMLFLWVFGNNVEDALGPVRYLVFYLLGGLAATALQTVVTLETASDQAAAVPNLGASGAISAVLGAYFVLLPHAKVVTLVFIVLIEVPAVVFLGVYFVFQAWQANFQLQNPPSSGGVAVFAHLGGIVFGLLAVNLFRKRRPVQPLY
jgi:membrane associated rhomboid family serine protease